MPKPLVRARKMALFTGVLIYSGVKGYYAVMEDPQSAGMLLAPPSAGEISTGRFRRGAAAVPEGFGSNPALAFFASSLCYPTRRKGPLDPGGTTQAPPSAHACDPTRPSLSARRSRPPDRVLPRLSPRHQAAQEVPAGMTCLSSSTPTAATPQRRELCLMRAAP